MTTEFGSWINELIPPDRDDPGELPAGVMDLLRATFEARGAVDSGELDDIFDAMAMDLARDAVALFMADVESTSSLKPRIEIYRDERDAMVVSWNGNYNAPAFFAMRAPEATCEIADNLRDHVVDDLGAAWPLCPTNGYGLEPRAVDGRAVWVCGHCDGEVSAIGQLPSSAAARNGLGSRYAAPAGPGSAISKKARKRRNRQQ